MKIKLLQAISALMLVLFLFSLTTTPASAAGLGVGPSVITIENATAGQEYLRSIFIDNVNTTDGVFTLAGSGDIATWFTFYTLDQSQIITQIAIPANGRGNAVVKFSVPADAKPLYYTGQIMVTGVPAATSTSSGAQVQMQMPINVVIQMVGAPPPTNTTPAATTSPAVITKPGEMNFTALSYSGVPKVGVVTKLEATLSNLTHNPVKSYLVAEVYLKDALVDTIKSDEISVPVGDNNIITAYFKPQTAGDYTLKAHIVYEGQQSQVITVEIKVAGGSGSGSGLPLITIIAIAVGVVVVIGIIFWVVSRRRRAIL